MPPVFLAVGVDVLWYNKSAGDTAASTVGGSFRVRWTKIEKSGATHHFRIASILSEILIGLFEWGRQDPGLLTYFFDVFMVLLKGVGVEFINSRLLISHIFVIIYLKNH